MSKYLDELRTAAESEFAASRASNVTVPTAEEVPVVEQPVVEQPIEEVTTEPEQPAVQPADEVPTAEPEVPAEKETAKRRVVHTKVVDLGDGSPPQVFKAATKDELIEKILTAQLNASKRIKELKKENRELQQKVQPDPATPVRDYKPRSLTPDEELEITTELQTNPTSALSKVLEALIGAGPDEIRNALAVSRDLKEREAIKEVGQSFITLHPEYPISNENEKLMAQYIQSNKLAWTVKNLELAFSDLVEAGLVALAEDTEIEPVLPTSVQEPEAEQPQAAQPAAQIPAARANTGLVEVPRRKRTVVGVSSSQTVATVEPEQPHEVSVEDLLKLSPSERRRIVMRQLGR